MRFVPEADIKYSGIEDEDGEPSDGELPIDLGAGSPHMTAQPSMLFLLSINSFGFSYGMTVSTLGLVILPSEAIYLYHDRCVRRPLWSAASAEGLRLPDSFQRTVPARRHAVMLGVMLGCTGITQVLLVGPSAPAHTPTAKVDQVHSRRVS